MHPLTIDHTSWNDILEFTYPKIGQVIHGTMTFYVANLRQMAFNPCVFPTTSHPSYYVTLFNVSIAMMGFGLLFCSSFPLKWAGFWFLRYGWPLGNQRWDPS
jgi:hypothetical protein